MFPDHCIVFVGHQLWKTQFDIAPNNGAARTAGVGEATDQSTESQR